MENNDAHTFLGDKDASTHVGGTSTVDASEPDRKNQVDGYTGDTKCLGCNEIIGTGTPTDPTDPVEPTDPSKTTESNPDTGASDNPQTGDNRMMALSIAVLFVSGFGVVATAVYCKKRKSVK